MCFRGFQWWRQIAGIVPTIYSIQLKFVYNYNTFTFNKLYYLLKILKTNFNKTITKIA